jgi:pSer/pThr/pTyr-binding forkhead associated (FHA) protein
MAAQFLLSVRKGPNPGTSHSLENNSMTIGREASNDIVINDSEVSRKHARLTRHGTSYVIEDLGSTNGTFINGQRLTGSQVLNPGDQISFGETISLVYESSVDINATVIASKAPATVAPIPKVAPVQVPSPEPAPAVKPAARIPSPTPVPAAAPKKKSSSVVIIVAILLVLCLVVTCVAVLLWVDADKTGARWCMFPFNIITSILGGGCP